MLRGLEPCASCTKRQDDDSIEVCWRCRDIKKREIMEYAIGLEKKLEIKNRHTGKVLKRDENQIKALLNLFNSGLSIRKAAEQVGLKYSTAYRICTGSYKSTDSNNKINIISGDK